tara:strand:+ start:204 stop:524 length:321 start_codon:yes stop_codon:yes gene_type:complete
MKILEFEEIKGGMSVLYKKDKEIYATKVISTSYGHPSVEMVTLQGGFIIYYGNTFAFDPEGELRVEAKPGINVYGDGKKAIYADNALNRTELLLESETILTDLNTE